VRTTIDLDEELLRTAKAISEVRGKTLSSVISGLAWRGLRQGGSGDGSGDRSDPATRNGFPLLSAQPGALPVTSEHVAELLDLADRDETFEEAVR